MISLAGICNRLVPLMLEQKWGRVVNLTSGIANQPELTAYAVSKAAVDKYVRDFAPSLAGTGVMMNLLDPGWLRTDLGGPNAPNDPSSVLPGALVPALLDDGISGRFFCAQDYAGKSLAEALAQAQGLQPLQPKPAIDGQNLPGDEVRPGGKEEHRLGHVFHAPVAPHRRLARKMRRLLLRRSLPVSIHPGATQLTLTSGRKGLGHRQGEQCSAALEAQ